MCTGENGFTSAMRKTFIGGYWPLNPGHPNFNEELIRLVDEFDVDCVYLQIQTPNVITEKTAKYIGAKCVVFNHSGDIRLHLDEWYYNIGQHITCTLFSNLADVKKLRSAGMESQWMEIGVDPTIFRDYADKLQNAPKIVFLANNYGAGYFPLSQHRIDLVSVLKQAFGETFKVFGSGWGTTGSGDFNGNQPLEALQISSADIVINCSHFDSPFYSSDRLLRSLACKTMVISKHYEGMDYQYNLGEDLVAYSELGQLVDQCKYYLENHEVREKIAAQGQLKVLNTNTFRHMSQNIMKHYYEYKNDFKI